MKPNCLVRQVVRLLSVLGLLASLRPALALPPVTLQIGFTPSAYAQSNRNDIEASFKVLGEAIGKAQGYQLSVVIRFYPDPTALDEAIAAGEVNFALFDALAFMDRRPQTDLFPAFVTSNQGQPGRRYLLLVRRDRGWHRLEDLRGRPLTVLQNTQLSMGPPWLESKLRVGDLGSLNQFFGHISYVGKPALAVLPVFFGRQDTCLVDEFAYRLMVELNPQVGTVLEPLASSEPLASVVVCVSKTRWSTPAFLPTLLKVLQTLHEQPAGKQILALFKIDQLLPYNDQQLATTRSVWSICADPPPEAKP